MFEISAKYEIMMLLSLVKGNGKWFLIGKSNYFEVLSFVCKYATIPICIKHLLLSIWHKRVFCRVSEYAEKITFVYDKLLVQSFMK